MANNRKKKKTLRTVHVNAGAGYDILIDPGILAYTGEYAAQVCPDAEKAAVLCDRNAFFPHAEPVEGDLYDAGFSCVQLLLEPGEEHKDLAAYSEILAFLADKRITRDDVVVAMGGGVTGDMAGFAAATYLRGLHYIQIPTTLLAMVDSSVGGKTAIDLPAGKNMAGAFCQPSLVLCDPDVLKTLPERYFADGCAEVIKYGVLYSREFFDALTDMAAVKKNAASVIETCVTMKRDAVEKDEFDRGERKKLNLGHTVGHAIEQLSGYKEGHGHAVAAGMAIIARAAAKKGYLSGEGARAIEEKLKAFGLPAGTDFSAEELAKAAMADKKASQRAIDLIVPREIGACDIVRIDIAELQEWIEAGLA
jgi:3-dehydroquinate synthase